MTERCGACGTVGVTNSTGRFVSRDCLRSSELSAELSTTRAQVAELSQAGAAGKRGTCDSGAQF